MKSTRHFLAAMLVAGFAMQATGATRMFSVYLESYAALQQQIFQGAQAFEIPELGSVPMLLSMSMPGASELNKNEPVALHVYLPDGEPGTPAIVLDVGVANTPEAFLGALLGASGGELPEAQNGRYVTSQGAAQVHGKRLLLARSADDLDVGLAVGVPAGLPKVPGVLRMQMAPMQVAGLLEQARPMMTAGMDTEQQKAMFDEVLGLYQSALEQVAIYEQGIGISEKGLAVRSRLVPAPGRAGEKIVASLQPAPDGWVQALDGDSLMAMVAGGYQVPEPVMQRVLDQYLAILAMVEDEVPVDRDMLRKLMQPSLAGLGAPTFFFADLAEDLSGLEYYGGALTDEASTMLQEMLEVQKSEAFGTYMKSSGMQFSEPEAHEVAGVTVYRSQMKLDEDAFQEKMQAAGAAMDPEEFANMQTFLNAFMGGQMYGATSEGMFFASGGDAQVLKALALLEGSNLDSEGGPDLLAQLDLPTAPYGVGRIDLLGMVRMGAAMSGEELPIKLPEDAGLGLLFAGWKSQGQVEQMMLLPAADIRAMSRTVRAATQQ